jgi:hypothetical protein
MGRRVNEGTKTRIKQDRSRDNQFSRFEMSQKTINTLGGVYQENRGHRVADEKMAHEWENSPFEDGKILSNWSKRKGWDKYYDHRFDKKVS